MRLASELRRTGSAPALFHSKYGAIPVKCGIRLCRGHFVQGSTLIPGEPRNR